MLRKIRYGLNEIKKNGRDPSWWKTRFNARIAGPTLGRIYGHEGIDMMSRDWDNLLILDACRADTFETVADLSKFDTYQRVESPGSSSPEWMEQTFAGRSFPDTVYVTANPWIEREAPNAFHEIIDLWVEEVGASPDDFRGVKGLEAAGFDISDVMPADVVVEHAVNALSEYSDKRLIVHFFQPHHPMIGAPDGTVREEFGNHTKQDYRDNLQYVLFHAWKCAEQLGGKSVFTADHGELFEERLWPLPIRANGHPSGLHHPKLTKVPWAEVTIGERREIVAETTTEQDVDQDVVNSRLRDLGYKID